MASARPRVQPGLSGNYQKVIQRFGMAVRTLQEEDGRHIHFSLPARAVAVGAPLLGQGQVFWKGKGIGIINHAAVVSTISWRRPPPARLPMGLESESAVAPSFTQFLWPKTMGLM